MYDCLPVLKVALKKKMKVELVGVESENGMGYGHQVGSEPTSESGRRRGRRSKQRAEGNIHFLGYFERKSVINGDDCADGETEGTEFIELEKGTTVKQQLCTDNKQKARHFLKKRRSGELAKCTGNNNNSGVGEVTDNGGGTPKLYPDLNLMNLSMVSGKAGGNGSEAGYVNNKPISHQNNEQQDRNYRQHPNNNVSVNNRFLSSTISNFNARIEFEPEGRCIVIKL